jgi:hypothetical protein
VRDEAPDIKVKSMIMCCLIKIIEHLWGYDNEHGAVLECRLARKVRRNFEKFLFYCHIVHNE